MHPPQWRTGAPASVTASLRAGTYCPYSNRVWGWRCGYAKPIVWDEVQYEGDVRAYWGKLDASMMADRFWVGFVMGVYVGHSETFGGNTSASRDDRWWSRGGRLRGDSPPLIARFHRYAIDSWHPPFGELTPMVTGPSGIGLVATGRFALFYLPSAGTYHLSLPGLPPSEAFCARQVERGSYGRRILAEGALGTTTLVVTSDDIHRGAPLIEMRRGSCYPPPLPPRAPPQLPPLGPPPRAPRPPSAPPPPPSPAAPPCLPPPTPPRSPPTSPSTHPPPPQSPPPPALPPTFASAVTSQLLGAGAGDASVLTPSGTPLLFGVLLCGLAGCGGYIHCWYTRRRRGERGGSRGEKWRQWLCGCASWRRPSVGLAASDAASAAPIAEVAMTASRQWAPD